MGDSSLDYVLRTVLSVSFYRQDPDRVRNHILYLEESKGRVWSDTTESRKGCSFGSMVNKRLELEVNGHSIHKQTNK